MRDLLRRCLERDVKMRLRDIGEARIAIQHCLVHPEDVPVPPPAQARSSRLPWAVAAFFAAAAGVALWSARTNGITLAEVQRLSIDLPDTEPLVPGIDGRLLAISPDGSRVVYASRYGGTTRLCLRGWTSARSSRCPGPMGLDAILLTGRQVGGVRRRRRQAEEDPG